MKSDLLMRKSAALLLFVAIAGPAAGAPPVRTPDERQTLIDLAHVLGEAHALHRICAGPSDDTWRGRMQKLLELEAPTLAMKAKLVDSFNAGYSAQGGKAKSCSAAAALEAAVARRGADLARRLSTPIP